MAKKESKIKIIERFKNEDIEKRKETLENLFYNIIKTKESDFDETRIELKSEDSISFIKK